MQCLLAGLNARFQPDNIVDILLQPLIEANQKVVREGWLSAVGILKPFHPGCQQRPAGLGFKERHQLFRQLRGIDKRKSFGGRLDEEIERVDHGHIGHHIHHDLKFGGRLRKDEARHVIAVGVLLPIDEMIRRSNAK